MFVAIKLLLFGILFVGTGGAVFSDWAKRHRALVALASCVSIVGAFYLFRDVYRDLYGSPSADVSAAITSNGARPRNDQSAFTAIGPDSVWSPPENVDLYSLCQGDGCLLKAMERHGASETAIEAAKKLDQSGSIDSFFYGFKELGGVDAGFVDFPFIMKGGNFLAFVNGKPNIMFARTLLGGTDGVSLLSSQLKPFFGADRQPDIWEFLEVSSSSTRSTGLQDILTVWDVRDGCYACETLGYVEIRFTFDQHGAFIGYEMGSPRKA